MLTVARRTRQLKNQILANREEAKRLNELRRELPEEPTYQTVFDWCTKGRRSQVTQEVVKLEYIVRPSGMCSSVEAYWRWIETLNGE